jgi:D-3-phosphoglycerate dehydrogenase
MPSRSLKGCCVLVTPTSYAKHDPRLRTTLEEQVGEVRYNPTGKPLTSAQLREMLPGADGYIAGLDAIDAQALQAADRLKVIARYGAGVDQVDLAACRARGIVVTNTPTANSVSVAEMTIGLMLALARSIPQGMQLVREGKWPRLVGQTLQGKVVGLVGFGAIGKLVAGMLQGFGCRVLFCDPFVGSGEARRLHCEKETLQHLLAEADFVSLHLPRTKETAGMVDAAFLGQMKPGAFLINTARGELVDEAALLEAIQTGRLGGVALDVFTQEPPDAQNPLLHNEKILVTPHLASQTVAAVDAMGWAALQDCLAVLRGERPQFPVA